MFIYGGQLYGDMWHLSIISIFIIIDKLIIFWPSNKFCELDFDTFPFAKANYMVTHGIFLSPLIIYFLINYVSRPWVGYE
jgi:hypothetical protein